MLQTQLITQQYPWDFSTIANRFINPSPRTERERLLVHSGLVFRKMLLQASKQSQEELDREWYSQRHSLTFRYIYAMVLAERYPEMARNLFFKIWNEAGSWNFITITAYIQDLNFTAYHLMTQVLQYGPARNWNEQTAYSQGLDTLLNQYLVQLEQLPIEAMPLIRNYITRYSTCGVLYVILARAIFETVSRDVTRNWYTECPLEQLSEIGLCLIQAKKHGIPDKYRYFFINYLLMFVQCIYLERIDWHNQTKQAGAVKTSVQVLNSLFPYLIMLFVYKLLPTQEYLNKAISFIDTKDTTDTLLMWKQRMQSGEDVALEDVVAYIRTF